MGCKCRRIWTLDNLFSVLALQCLQLVTLDISVVDIYGDSDNDDTNEPPRLTVTRGQSSLQLLLQNLKELRHVKLRTEFDIIDDLAALPSLEHLTLHSGVRSTLPDLTPSQRETIRAHQFPNLRKLNFDSTNDNTTDIWHIVQLSCYSPLRDVRLRWEMKRPDSLRNILAIYARSTGRMETIEFLCGHANQTQSLPYSDRCITMGHLSSLFNPRFKFLTNLSIFYPILFDLNDDNMIAIAQHLPHLRILQLGNATGASRVDWPSPRVTIRSLFALEKACCELERLDLSIDLREVTSFQELEAGPRKSKLSYWEILHSEIRNPKAVAFTLATLFPRLTHINEANMPLYFDLMHLKKVGRFLRETSHLRDSAEDSVPLDRTVLEEFWKENSW